MLLALKKAKFLYAAAAVIVAAPIVFAANGVEINVNDRVLTIKGETDALETVTIRLDNNEGELIYLYQTKADKAGRYNFKYQLENDEAILELSVRCGEEEKINKEIKISKPGEVKEDVATPRPQSSYGGGGGGGGGKSYGAVVDSFYPSSSTESPSYSAKPSVSDTETKTGAFADTKGHWAESNIRSLAEKGIVLGDEKGCFNPDNMITRAEFLSMAVRAFHVSGNGKDIDFKDVKDTDWFYGTVAKALENGIISYDDYFRPYDNITREEIAKIITAFAADAQIDSLEQYSDYDKISSWAVPYMEKAVANRLISGYDDNTLRPQATATRAECAAIIDRVLEI